MLNWNDVKHGARLLMAAMAGLAVQADAKAPAPRAPHPALWKLADADTTIYLFGTIHLLPKDYKWRTPAIDKAVAASDELVLETVIDAAAIESAKAVATLGVSQGLPPLIERVPADKRAALAARMKEMGIPDGMLDHYESWAAAMVLLGGAFKNVGLDAGSGVERVLASGGKKVIGLETIPQQFGFLDSLSAAAQQEFLIGVLDDDKSSRDTFADMLKAWTYGDVKGIATSFDQEVAFSPELRDVLMKQRNARWADWLAERLEQPGTILVAVGAGHLAGADSVQAMLAKRGIKVERVE